MPYNQIMVHITTLSHADLHIVAEVVVEGILYCCNAQSSSGLKLESYKSSCAMNLLLWWLMNDNNGAT
jgi:hypothetical protein